VKLISERHYFCPVIEAAIRPDGTNGLSERMRIRNLSKTPDNCDSAASCRGNRAAARRVEESAAATENQLQEIRRIHERDALEAFRAQRHKPEGMVDIHH